MSTPLKLLIYFVFFVGVAILALIILVETQVTPEKIRENFLPQIEKATHRRVDFGAIEIGLFSGVTVTDLKVMKKAVSEDFISVKALKLHYQLWPLLRGSVVIDQVLLEHPSINVSRQVDGKFNFDDLINRSEALTDKEQKQKPASSNLSVSKVPLDVLIKEVHINDGELYFTDQYKNQRTPYRYQLQKLNLSARQITFNDLFPIDISAVVNGSQVDISGHYNIAAHTGDLLIHLAPLDLIQFAPYYRHLIPVKLGSALLSANLEVELLETQFSSKGHLECAQVDLVSPQIPGVEFNQENLQVDYALAYDVNKDKLSISTLLLNFNGLKIGAEGEVDLKTDDPFLVATVTMDQLDLRQVMQTVPPELIRDYQKYSLAGSLDGRFELAGKLSTGLDLLKNARLNLIGVQASTNNFRAGISGELNYADQQLAAENLVFNYGELESSLKLKAENLFGDIIRGEFSLTAKEVDLNKLLARPKTETRTSVVNDSAQAGQQQLNQQTKGSELGPFHIPAEMTGSLSIGRLLYKELSMDNVTADINLKNDLLAITNLVAQLNGGELKGNSMVDLGVQGLAYQGQMALTQPDVTTLVSGLVPQTGQSVSGQLQWQNNFSGHGTVADKLLPALQMKGQFNLHQGMVKGSPLLAQLATFLGDPELKVLSFKAFTGQYDLRDGLARLNGDLDSSKTKLKAQGSVSIGGRINLKLDAHLAPEGVDRLRVNSNLKQLLTNQDGWGVLPLKIGGTLAQPTVGVDTKALQEQTLEKTKEQASRKLLEKLAPDTKDNEPIKQLLDNTLNKLFGN